MKQINRPIGAVSVLVVAALAVVIGAAPAQAANPKFPSWSDVQKAKKNVTAKNAEIKTITTLIGSLQDEAAAAGKVAAERGEEYLNAKSELDAATTAANKLQSQASAAATKAKTSAAEAGQLAAQLARQGDGDISLQLFLQGHDAKNLLDVLGTMSKLSESSANIFAQAQQDQKTAKALSDQAALAKVARAKKKTAASNALAVANAASSAAQAKVAAGNKEQSVATAQLASLKNVSASTLKDYYAGVAWEKKQEEQKTPPPDGKPTGGSPPSVPNGSQVSGAIAFARAQLGKPYVLDGAGPNVWDCSGLTLKAYASVGIYIGTHSATNQYNTLKSEGRLVPLSDRKAGDILWYSDGGSTSGTKYHVTLYIGNGEMIEAPYPGVGVRIAAVRFGDLVPYAGRPTG
jgi:cell wall-associated NlpC family hydrolase